MVRARPEIVLMGVENPGLQRGCGMDGRTKDQPSGIHKAAREDGAEAPLIGFHITPLQRGCDA
jgi:hypothetical protein